MGLTKISFCLILLALCVHSRYCDGRSITGGLIETVTHQPAGLLAMKAASTTVSASAINTVVMNVKTYGAKGDGSDATQAFVNAWKEACSSSAPVTLLVPASSNNYLLKPIAFSGPCKSSVTVSIQGTILASSKISDWDGKNRRRWIEFVKVDNLYVQGGGIIDGSGAVWWKINCKVDKSKPCLCAPTAMTFDSCNNLRVEKLMIKNSQQMHITFDGCNNVKVSYLTIKSPGTSPNTDGIHVTGTTNIDIYDCDIGTGDDCISIVSGSQSVTATNTICGPGHGISIGSLGSDGAQAQVSGVLVDKAQLTGTTNGVRIKTWPGGRGYAKDITFQYIEMHNVKNPIIINQNYCDTAKGSCGKQSSSAVAVTNVVYKNIKGTSATDVAIYFDCSQSLQCRGVTLENINLVSAGGGVAKGICNNIQLTKTGTVIPSTCSKSLLQIVDENLSYY